MFYIFTIPRSYSSGGGLGIGRAVARVLAASGCDLMICDINRAAAQQTAELVGRAAAQSFT